MPANFEKSTIDVGPLGRSEQQRVLVDVADVEPRRVGDPGDRLVRHDHRGRQEAALGADLDPARPGRADGRCPASGRRSGRSAPPRPRPPSARPRCPVESATYHCRFKKRSLAAFRIRRRYDFGSTVVGRVRRAVHDRRVVELLHPDRDVRRARDLLGLAERVGLVLPGGRVSRRLAASRIVVRVVDRPVLSASPAARTTARTSSARTRSCRSGRRGSAPACRRGGTRGRPCRPSGRCPRSGPAAAELSAGVAGRTSGPG